MLDKYLKFFIGAKSQKARAQEASADASHSADAPPLPPLEPPVPPENQIIDTHDVAPESTVTSMMDIETHGKPNQIDEMLQRFLGHQPISDENCRIIGYELKLKGKTPVPDTAAGATIQTMQDEMLIVSVIDLEFQQALGNKLIFIHLSLATLHNPIIDQLPKQKVAVAIHLEPHTPLIHLTRCQELAQQGILIALEDFEYKEEHEPFLKLCKYVRIDTSKFDALVLSEQIERIRKAASPLLIAKGVETDDAFEAYRKLAFNYFQGYYFAQLQPDSPQRLDNNRLRVMEMLNMVMNHADINELEEKVKLDAALSYKLLSYINSPANGLQQTIRSIGHALTLLGYDQLYRWLTLLLFSAGHADERSRALLKNALIRARFTETLGKMNLAPNEQGGLFIVGIFSVLDALLNTPMEKAITMLHLSEPVVDALMHDKGIYAPYLKLAKACEDFDQDTIAKYAATCGLDADTVNIAHVKALIWAEELES